MKVVILCGGKGTRLREETEFRPKPMVPIGNRPILWHIMKIYASHGFNEFVLCLGYKGEIIKDFFRNYQWMTSDVSLSLGDLHAAPTFHSRPEEDWKITLADTGEETLTAGRLERIEKYIDGDDFLLTYGDGVGNIDIRASVERHRASRKVLTLTAVHPPGRFGEMVLTEDRQVREFNEKPQTEEGWINGGFFVASRRLFDYVRGGEKTMLEQEPMRRLVAEDQLQAHCHKGFWQPMDTYQEFLLLNRLWQDGKAPWKTW